VSTAASVSIGSRYPSGYAARDVARLIGLTIPQIMGIVRAGCIAPRRGQRREYRFSFQDLVVLRTARDLMERMPARRVHHALGRLKEQLPTGRQLTALRITAEGDAIVVRDGAAAWNPVSGQAVLDLDVASLATQVAPLVQKAAQEAREAEEELGAEDWYRMGCDLEPCDAVQAEHAYRRALELDPDHADARLNLGRLLHEGGQIPAAEAQYRRVLDVRPQDATAAFNLGVALEDMRRPQAAVDAYERALGSDPEYVDAHYNLARLWERMGDPQRALRHLQACRRLAESGEPIRDG
jgi:tetratricopeptide (TPR) repeat protein